jgi:hypothetical protein
MLLKAQNIHFVFILIVFLLPSKIFAQVTDRFAFPLDSLTKDSIAVNKGTLVAFRDTIFSDADTLVVRKEVWIKEKELIELDIDSLFLADISVVRLNKIKLSKRLDTIIIIQDTVLSRNERVLQEIKEFSERKNLFSMLLKNILVFESYKTLPTSTLTSPTQNSDKKYEPFEGKIIRSVNVKVLKVFGPTLQNPDQRATSLLEKGGNFIHIKSHRWLIRNKLLFKKGDHLNSLNMSESERLLRENVYMYDARIAVVDTSTTSGDSVDVVVTVQDIWSISAGVGMDPGRSRYDFSIKDVNFLGFGQTFENKFRIDPSVTKGYNYLSSYTIPNLYNTFFSGRAFYTYQYGQTIYGASINRDFISPAIKWAGGVAVDKYDGFYASLNQDSVEFKQKLSFVQSDMWLGYGYNISPSDAKYKGSRLIGSVRLLRANYSDKPILSDTIYNSYYSSHFYFASVGVIRRRYYKDSYIFRFGRTEDIPEGDLITFTVGMEDRFTSQRPYMAFNSSFSRYTQLGYIYSRFAIGAFYDHNEWNEGVGLIHLLYFTPLIKVKSWRWRNFIGVRYTEGINVRKGSTLHINQEQGLRGFQSGLLLGTSKFVINYESNIFPPLNLLGFKMAFIAFADMAWIANREKLFDKKNFFPGFGVGVKIKNEHLIFGTVQLMLGYYPNSSTIGARELNIYERTKIFYNYYDFQFSKPTQIPFF